MQKWVFFIWAITPVNFPYCLYNKYGYKMWIKKPCTAFVFKKLC